jgi:hypothetical protein
MLEYNKKVINLVEDKERISQENRLDKWGLEESGVDLESKFHVFHK